MKYILLCSFLSCLAFNSICASSSSTRGAASALSLTAYKAAGFGLAVATMAGATAYGRYKVRDIPPIVELQSQSLVSAEQKERLAHRDPHVTLIPLRRARNYLADEHQNYPLKCLLVAFTGNLFFSTLAPKLFSGADNRKQTNAFFEGAVGASVLTAVGLVSLACSMT